MAKKVKKVKKVTKDPSIPRKVLKVWLDSWENSERKVIYPRGTCDALRKEGTSAVNIDDRIGVVLTMPESTRSRLDKELLHTYRMIRKECEMGCSEYAATTPSGVIFELKSAHGREDKQTIAVEDGSLADIIAKNSVHNKDKDEK